jgi:hypothetical protein
MDSSQYRRCSCFPSGAQLELRACCTAMPSSDECLEVQVRLSHYLRIVEKGEGAPVMLENVDVGALSLPSNRRASVAEDLFNASMRTSVPWTHSLKV